MQSCLVRPLMLTSMSSWRASSETLNATVLLRHRPLRSLFLSLIAYSSPAKFRRSMSAAISACLFGNRWA